MATAVSPKVCAQETVDRAVAFKSLTFRSIGTRTSEAVTVRTVHTLCMCMCM